MARRTERGATQQDMGTDRPGTRPTVKFTSTGGIQSTSDALRVGREMGRHLRQLATEIDAVKRSASFTKVLEMMARLWRYSPFNRWLILQQRPTATSVASRSVWEAKGRTVRRGQSAIAVLAPAPSLRPPFVIVPVYDVAQTRGPRLPRLDLMLHGATPEADLLEAAAGRMGVVVLHGGLPPNVIGRSQGGTITLQRRLSGQERAATIAHELAHEILHTMNSPGEATHAQIETEADATSYVVMRALGLPSKAPAYIAWQGGSGALLMGSMKRVQRAARRILLAHEQASAAASSRRNRGREKPATH